MVIALDVFLAGMALLPPIDQPAPAAPLPPAAPAPQPATPAPAAPVAAAAVDAQQAAPTAAAAEDAAPTAAVEVPPAADASAAAPAEKPEKAETAEKNDRPEKAVVAEKPDPAEKPALDRKSSGEKASDKDTAREAWRRNLPDIATDKNKATILIPIRGSIEGATYHVTNKPRAVLVTLPQGESMITMQYYRIKHDGFRQLWIKQEEGKGTSLRVVLEHSVDPTVEIKDDFVRVTIRRPDEEPAESADTSGE
jgi:hypothetical protein